MQYAYKLKMHTCHDDNMRRITVYFEKHFIILCQQKRSSDSYQDCEMKNGFCLNSIVAFAFCLHSIY